SRRGARGCRSRRAGRALHPLELVGDDLLDVELLEQRPRLLELLPGRELARRPAADPCVVLAGQHDVARAVLLFDLAELERPRDVAVVAEELVERLRAEGQ